jgi:hypothetical protein
MRKSAAKTIQFVLDKQKLLRQLGREIRGQAVDGKNPE